MEITLSEVRTTAWEAMLNVQGEETLVAKLQAHLNTIADSHIESNLDNEFNSKTVSEKETLLS